MVVSSLPVSPPPQYPIKWASPSLRPISSSAQKEEEVREQKGKSWHLHFWQLLMPKSLLFRKRSTRKLGRSKLFPVKKHFLGWRWIHTFSPPRAFVSPDRRKNPWENAYLLCMYGFKDEKVASVVIVANLTFLNIFFRKN